MTLQESIISDPEILNGTPVFRGTRVPVKNLFDYLNSGDSYAVFLSDFDYVTEAQVLAVLESLKLQFSYNIIPFQSAA
jgi:uncharacterized protein (DUF433 family)